MFDSMRIRTKLALALAVPLLALVVVTLVVVADSSQEADEAAERSAAIAEQVELATASLGPSGVISTLATERNSEALSVIGQLGAAGDSGDPEENRATNDAAVEAFRATIAASPVAVQEAYAGALDALDSIEDARGIRDGYTGPETLDNAAMGAEIFDAYTTVIDEVFDANTRVALAVDDTDLRNGATVIDLSARSEENQTRLIRSLVFAGIGGGVDSPEEIAETTALWTNILNLDNELATSAGGAYAPLVTTALESPDVDVSRELLGAGVAGEAVPIDQLLGEDVTLGITAVGDLGDAAAAQLVADAEALQAEADRERSDAESRNTLVLVLAGAVILAAVGLALLASRSITRPLRRLTLEAEDMAGRRLPDTVQAILDTPLGEDVVMPELAQVPTAGGAEIAEVAGALNTVQASAADLAVEQAVLRRNISDSFVNLGRRNQNLLTRQLDSITDMERNASDPDELRKLFTLDHLATRMRRNAESLLLLAGLEPHRQWTAPVPLIDVLRGALGEVEDYERVRIDRLDDATIAGTAAADLTHLVAELLENALNFSPPGRDVEIVGQRKGERYTLYVIDNGVGMSAEAIEEANVRLAGGESFTVAPSRYLGHYVVGIQAARLDVGVRLVETPAGGVTATIEISSVVVEDAPGGGAPAPHLEASPTPRPADEAPAADADLPAAPVAVATAPEPAPAPEPRGPAATSTVDAGTTASGYKKRVRGANTPRTEVTSARRDDAAPAAAEDATGAEGLRNLLSGLQAGQERGLAEARGDATETTEEEGR